MLSTTEAQKDGAPCVDDSGIAGAEVPLLENKATHYSAEIRAALPARLFRREPSRLIWLAFHVAVTAGCIFTISRGTGGLLLAIPAAIAIGLSFSALAFVAHEILHGAVVRGRRMQLFLGGIAFSPFMISPRLWVSWHNRAHHGLTMKASGEDPDAAGTLADYETNRVMRIFDHVTVGRWRPAGILLFMIGFTAQGLRVLLSMARRLDYLSRPQFLLACAETIFAALVWCGLAAAIGVGPFLFAFVIPFIVANTLVMSYILTNHNLSPLTEVNDPLLNSLSVTAPRPLEILHLNFGMHVEHHLFPWMSSRHAPEVRHEIVRRWPERYQSMPLHIALVRLWSTARVYSDPQTLCDPRSGRRWPALLPRARRSGTQEECR